MTNESISLLERVIYTLEHIQLPANAWGLDTMQKIVGCSQAVRQVLQTEEAVKQAAKAADDTDEAAKLEAENGR